jgi:hypothetical protein
MDRYPNGSSSESVLGIRGCIDCVQPVRGCRKRWLRLIANPQILDAGICLHSPSERGGSREYVTFTCLMRSMSNFMLTNDDR